MLEFRVAQSPLYKYGPAIAFTLIATGLSWVSWPVVQNAPFIYYFGAVVLSAWIGGLGPGMLSAALAVVVVDFLLIEPQYQVFTSVADLLLFGIFSLIAFFIGWLEQSRHQTQQSLREVKDELAVILHSVADGITAQDAEGKVVFANLAAAKLTGYSSPDEMMNTPPVDIRRKLELFDAENNPLPFSVIPRNHVFEYGESKTVSLKIRFLETGEERWIQISSSPVFDNQGKVKLAVNISRDITDRTTMEHGLSQLAAIVQNSNDAIIGKSLEGIITSWNPGAEQLYGYTPQEAIGQHISLIFRGDSESREFQLLDRIKEGEKVEHYETRRVHKDGHEVDVSLTISPIRTSSGHLIGYSGIERDITERKKLERLEHDTQERLRKLLDLVVAFVGVLTPDGVLVEVNRPALEIASLEADEVIGKPFDETYWWSFSEESRSRVRDAIRKASQGETVRYDVDVRIGEGRFLTIDFMLAPLYDDEGQIQYLIPSAIDVTERNRLTQQLEQEKRKLTTILNAIPGIVYEGSGEIDTELRRVDFITNYAETMLGYPLEEWTTNPNFWKKVVHPDDWDTAVVRARESFADGTPGPIPFRCITKDGRVLNVETYTATITDSIGRRVGTCGLVLDVSERKQRELEILQLTSMIESQRQQLDSTISNIPGIVTDVSIHIESAEQKVNFISDYVEVMLGYSPTEWAKNSNFWQEVIFAEDLDAIGVEILAAYTENRIGNVQFRCRNAKGEMVYAEAFFNFVKESETHVRQFAVIMDVTQRKAVEDALKTYMDELRRSNEELEQFAYVASHDLQEPLRMVTSYLQLIEKRYADALDDEAKEFINFAVDGAVRMKSLINDLLSYSRLQRSTADYTPVKMNDVLARVLYNLQLSIEDTQATITHDELPEVSANEGQMTQLLQNLIGNALKFHGDQPPQIHVGVTRDKKCWQFSVRDNGIGIEPEYQERIFAIFQRLHTRQNYPGTGIGLAICRKIVDKHGGKIWVESQPGEGTVFYFTIPIERRKRSQIYAWD